MKYSSTRVLASKEGSTEPVALQQQLETEAADIRRIWSCHGPQALKRHFPKFDRLYRHKSLVLELVLDDYVKQRPEKESSSLLTDYCQRFSGLGDSLERSIYEQLQVMDYLNEHPEILDLERGFDWPQVGDTFLTFLVLEELGHGALAKVYLCRQQDLANRLVVVKVNLCAKVEEASLLAKMRHPHIMPVYWAASDQETYASYLCMPFVGRSTLVDVIETAFRGSRPQKASVILEAANLWTKPLDYEGASNVRTSDFINPGSSFVSGMLHLAVSLADGLAFAHGQDVIHGDIKPSNVLITPEGRPLLIDFNLGRDQWRTDGPAGGTLMYMAPEQVRYLAERQPLSFPVPEVATDIYSFGVLLCELLTGSPPYAIGKNPPDTTAAAHELYYQQKCVPLECALADRALDPDLRQLLQDCLAFDPDRRPQSMALVKDRLARQLSIPFRSARFLRKHLVASVLAAAIAVAAVSGAGVYWATRPPLADQLFDQGVSARRAGDWHTAVARFTEVLLLDDGNRLAELEIVRCHMERGDYTAAADRCYRVVLASTDPEVMALLAYCNNLAGNPDVAASWYGEAMKRGFRTPAVMNNLSVSLLLKNTTMPHAKRLRECQELLVQALQLAPESPVVRMNIVRLAIEELTRGLDPSIDLTTESLDWLCQNCPDNGDVWHTGFIFQKNLAERERASTSQALAYLQKAVELGGGPTLEQLNSSPRYAEFRQLQGFNQVPKRAAETGPRAPREKPIGRLMPLTAMLADNQDAPLAAVTPK